MGRAPCCEKVGLKKGRWTAEEDETLTKYIQANGEGSWRSLPKNAGLLRCGKSCRLRWINYLRTDLKRGNISVEEEDTIIKLHASLGNKWSLIASQLPGRTDNEIKNYWNSHLSRKIHTFRRSTCETLPIIMNLAKISTVSKRGSKTSKAAMKKNKSSTHTDNIIATASQEKAKESIFDNGAMPPPPTLEKETLPSAISCQDDQNLVLAGPFQDTGGGTLGAIEERERVVLSNGEERESENSMLCPTNERETAILGPYEGGVLDDSGVLSFNDILDNGLLDSNGVLLSLSCEEKESGVMDTSKMATSEDLDSGNLSSNGEWLSCSSTTSYFDDGRVDWDWEDVVRGHEIWGDEREEMLSWLCESDNGERDCQNFGGEMDCEKQKAMVDWLLS